MNTAVPIIPGGVCTLGLGYHVFCGTTNSFCFSASSRDPLVLEKLGDQRAAQRIYAVRRYGPDVSQKIE